MEINELLFVPHSDLGANELNVIEQHKKLITEGKFSDATTLLETEDINKGVRASLLNSIQNKIRRIQLYMLNEFVAENDEYFSDTQPDINFMRENGYTRWLRPW